MIRVLWFLSCLGTDVSLLSTDGDEKLVSGKHLAFYCDETLTKTKPGKKVFIWFTGRHHSPSVMEGRTGTSGQSCFLPCSCGSLTLFSYTAQDHLTRGGST